MRLHFEEFLTPERRRRLLDVLSLRTRWVTVVLEDIRHAHNISAVLRSCDAFGIQDVHVLECGEPFEAASKIALGSQRWLTIHHYSGPHAARACLAALGHRNYRLVGTGPPGIGTHPFQAITLERPLAIAFGNECRGLSPQLAAACEGSLLIPMYGFVESLNISVAAAIILQDGSSRLRQTTVPWDLAEEETAELLYDWTRKSVPSVDAIEARWRERQCATNEAGRP